MNWTWDINENEDCLHCLCFINELEPGLHWYCAYQGEKVPHWSGGCEDWISKTQEKRE